eukprot:4452846-Prymnesium_polylepis.1
MCAQHHVWRAAQGKAAHHERSPLTLASRCLLDILAPRLPTIGMSCLRCLASGITYRTVR